ncbi:MAG: DUF2723 domain-containing protein [Anaerolineae bacterium]|nr:DUF2723 domain-containing protein [Anaerolineae bacterium]
MNHMRVVVPAVLFAGVLGLFAGTLATEVLFGDPGEYTFVPYIGGVIHPPGYAFYTLLAGVWQRLVPVGSVAYRAHLLSAAAGALLATLVYGCVRALTPPDWSGLRAYLPGVSAAVGLAAAHDIWQHASHANAHIITVTLAALALFLLLRWDAARPAASDSGRPGWFYLYAFAFVAGASITHHALLAFSFPAWGLFILAAQPRLLRDWRRLLALVGCFAAGLVAWLYFPIRSATGVSFGPQGMHTLDGFLNLVLARGLTVNLFHFGLDEQWQRALVFLTLLALQFNIIQIALAALGFVRLARRVRRAALLMGVFLVVNLGFIVNTVQDVMAYLMVPFMGLAVLGGVGVVALIAWLDAKLPGARWAPALLALLLIAPPLWSAASLWPYVNLNGYTAAADYVDAVYARFAGKAEGAVLLADWEHLTPLWYAIYVEERALPEADLKLVYVTAGANPWVDNAWAHFDAGPVYVTGYRRALVDAGFRLRPARGDSLPPGDLYRVLLPTASLEPAPQYPVGKTAGGVEVVGYDLPLRAFAPGDIAPLVVYLRAEGAPPESIIFPYAELGDIAYPYTTDSHWLAPWWEPGETIGERYDIRLPPDIAPGVYPLRLGLRDLIAGEDLLVLELGELNIAGDAGYQPPPLLVDIGHRAGLEAAWAGPPLVGVSAPWGEPVTARPGDRIDVTLGWRALAPVEESYTVFVHLIDGANRVWAQKDYTPLGGAFPTQLWFPKWLPGQAVWDPSYRLDLPDDIPPGDYWIEVGMYGMTSLQRIPQFDEDGNLTGDRYILGAVRVGG